MDTAMAELRRYNEMCAADAEFEKPGCLYSPGEWDAIAIRLANEAGRLHSDKQVFVADRAADCRQRAQYVRRINAALRQAKSF